MECGSNETAECTEAREQINADAKAYLQKIAERILDYLEKLQTQIEASEDLTDEEKQAFLVTIDEKVEIVNDIL